MLQDSLAVLPPSTPLGWGATVFIGAAAALGTALVRKAGATVDRLTGSADERVRKVLGPALPVVAVGLSYALPLLGNAIGITDLPPSEVVANAPVAAISGIVLREVSRRFLLPLVRR